jgi:tagatose-1,6-bisphosphate aldolase non-catalytic subunit AgaZ/GatZ
LLRERLMRALVAAETSGSLRSAFETVITETPAYWAMSFKRTIIRRQNKQ